MLYAGIDALFAGSRCESSRDGCRFGVTGREPYVTSVELAAVVRAVGRQGGPLSPKRRALPLTRNRERERICPLLDARLRCSIHESRPFAVAPFFVSAHSMRARTHAAT
jgi:hypothetical protein